MKKLIYLILVVIVALGLMVSMIGAKGPVNKVTGEVWIDSGGESFQHLVFDVYDREGEDKGYIYWYGADEDVDITEPYRTSPVLCFNFIDENTAWFAIEPDPDRPQDLPAGCLVLKVVDGGSPGAVYDEVHAEPLPDPELEGREDDACAMVANETEPSLEAPIVGGNLVVHYYE